MDEERIQAIQNMDEDTVRQNCQSLTQRRIKVLRLFLDHKNDSEIAQVLTICQDTVRGHLRKIYLSFFPEREEEDNNSLRQELKELARTFPNIFYPDDIKTFINQFKCLSELEQHLINCIAICPDKTFNSLLYNFAIPITKNVLRSTLNSLIEQSLITERDNQLTLPIKIENYLIVKLQDQIFEEITKL